MSGQEKMLMSLKHDQNMQRRALKEFEQNQKTMLALIKKLEERRKKEIEQAKKDLERTTITAPCRGKINKADVAVGDLLDGTVGTPQPLTTIMSMDPMYVYFQITDAEFNEIYAHVLGLVKKTMGDKYDPSQPINAKQMVQFLEENNIAQSLEVVMRLPNEPEGEYPHSGMITYSENTADRNTGTITLRTLTLSVMSGMAAPVQGSLVP